MSDDIEVIQPTDPVSEPVADPQADVPAADAASESAQEPVVEGPVPEPEVEPEVEPTPVPPMERVEVGSIIELTPRGWMAHLMYGGARRLHGEGATIEAAVSAAFGVTEGTSETDA